MLVLVLLTLLLVLVVAVVWMLHGVVALRNRRLSGAALLQCGGVCTLLVLEREGDAAASVGAGWRSAVGPHQGRWTDGVHAAAQGSC